MHDGITCHGRETEGCTKKGFNGFTLSESKQRNSKQKSNREVHYGDKHDEVVDKPEANVRKTRFKKH